MNSKRFVVGAALELTVEDAGTGLKQVSVVLTQGTTETVLADESFNGPGTTPVRTYDLGSLIEDNHDVQEGPASLAITASDYSYRNFFSGNQIEMTADFRFDLYPAAAGDSFGFDLHESGRIESACSIVCRRMQCCREFRWVHTSSRDLLPTPLIPDLRFALFAFAYNLPADTPVRLLARDGAGNEALSDVSRRLAARQFRNREIILTESFLQKVVPEIVSRTPGVQDQGTLIGTYVEINSRLRRENHEAIAELSKQSAGQFLWGWGRFTPNSAIRRWNHSSPTGARTCMRARLSISRITSALISPLSEVIRSKRLTPEG